VYKGVRIVEVVDVISVFVLEVMTLLKSVTLHLACVYGKINPASRFRLTLKDCHKCLTYPSEGVKNNSLDNEAVFFFFFLLTCAFKSG
jgi:hypothetical protein